LGNPKIFAKFATTSLWTTRLPDISLGGGKNSSSDSVSSSDSAPAAEGPRIDTQGDSNAEGMAQGVGGMLAKADMGTQLGAGGGGKMGQVGSSIDSVGKGVATQGGQWLWAALQIFGLALGGVVVYGMLRALPYCEACSQFLSQKGTQTRYYLT